MFKCSSVSLFCSLFKDYVLHTVLLISFLEAEGGGLSRERRYDLSGRGLTGVPDHIPQHAEYVSLHINQISRLRGNDFYHLKRCVFLNLGLNRISVIEREAFDGLERLGNLILDFNKLKVLSVEMFAALRSLQLLSLASNEINSITDDTFNGLGKLTYLDLNFNQLTILSQKMFAGLWSLESLMLKQNNITTVNEEAFDDLPIPLVLDLADNPVNCEAPWHCWLWKKAFFGSIRWLFKSSPCFVQGLVQKCFDNGKNHASYIRSILIKIEMDYD